MSRWRSASGRNTASDVFYIYFLVLWFVSLPSWPSCGQCWAQPGALRFIPSTNSTSGHHLPRLSSPGSLCQLLPSLLPTLGGSVLSVGAQQGSRKGFLSVGEQSTQMAAVAPSSSLEAKGIAELLCLTPQRRLPESRVCVLTDKLLLQGLERDPPSRCLSSSGESSWICTEARQAQHAAVGSLMQYSPTEDFHNSGCALWPRALQEVAWLTCMPQGMQKQPSPTAACAQGEPELCP